MDEYIEREAAMTVPVLPKEHREYQTFNLDDAYEQGWNDALENLVNVPTADVAPVRHARWVDNHCTACGMMPMGDEMWKHLDLEPPLFERFMDYCPSCGCRMDG